MMNEKNSIPMSTRKIRKTVKALRDALDGVVSWYEFLKEEDAINVCKILGQDPTDWGLGLEIEDD